MKKILGILAVVCWGANLEAKINITACCGGFNSHCPICFQATSDSPLLFKATNHGGAKARLDITVFKKQNGVVEAIDDESFNVIGNGIYIAPNNSEEIKLCPYIENNTDTQEFVVVFRDSSGSKTTIPLTAIPNQRGQIKLDRIEKDKNGILKAITESVKE